MQKQIAKYQVIVQPSKQTGTNKKGYVAFVPKLGIADDGFTIEEALKNIRAMIRFHLNSLMAENEQISSPV